MHKNEELAEAETKCLVTVFFSKIISLLSFCQHKAILPQFRYKDFVHAAMSFCCNPCKPQFLEA